MMSGVPGMRRIAVRFRFGVGWAGRRRSPEYAIRNPQYAIRNEAARSRHSREPSDEDVPSVGGISVSREIGVLSPDDAGRGTDGMGEWANGRGWEGEYGIRNTKYGIRNTE